ncbi:hypothetical protein [Piscirickettsia salmonis]|uniref:hypothetical protein n=1 Tax=Piscirickettsia salmonis TaxID=1238 RepID=UPI003A7F9A44
MKHKSFISYLRFHLSNNITPLKQGFKDHYTKIKKQKNKEVRKRRYLGRYFAPPMMQNRRAKRDDYKPSAALVTGHYVP